MADINLEDLSEKKTEPQRKFFPQGMQRRRRGEVDALPPEMPFPEEDRPRILEIKVIQSALAIFLGWLGAHKFYQGKTLQGVIYLLLFWTCIPGLISIIEGIRYLFMPVEDFYKQYIKKEPRREKKRRLK